MNVLYHSLSRLKDDRKKNADAMMRSNSAKSTMQDSPLLKSNFVLHRWSPLRHETTLSNSKVFFHPLRTSVPCLGTDLLFQLFNRAFHDPFSHSASFRAPTLTCRTLRHSLATARRRSFPSLNLHRVRVRRGGGFLQVVVSKAREHTVLVYVPCPFALPIQH